MPYNRRSEEMQIRAALTAEADRAPAVAGILAALPDAIARREARDRRWGMAGAAVAMAAVVIPLVLVVHSGTRLTGRGQQAGATDSRTQSAPPSSPAAPTSTAAPSTTGAAAPPFEGPIFPARYLPTSLPPGWVATDRATWLNPDGLESVAGWMAPGAPSDFPSGAALSILSAPVRTLVATQVGALRQVDVNGAVGTLRVATQQVGDVNTSLYYDDLWWSPEPGVVVTLSMGNATTDPSALLIPMARSVAPSRVTTEVPFRLPALPHATSLVSESVQGTPRNWFVDGVVGPHGGTVLSVSWGPGYQATVGKPNVTVRGVPSYFNGNDDDAYITTKVDGYLLTVQHDGPMSEATLVRIIDGMTFYPDARYSWLNAP